MVDEDQRMGYHSTPEEDKLVHELLIDGSSNSNNNNNNMDFHVNKNGHCNPYQWVEIIPLTPLKGGYPETRHNYFYLTDEQSKQIGTVYIFI